MNVRHTITSLLVGATVMLSGCQLLPVEPAADTDMAGDTDTTMEMDVALNSAEEEANIAVVDAFFVGLVENKDAEETGSYLSDDFVSNQPMVAGKQGMMDFATWQAENQPDANFVDEIHTIATGDLIIKHYTYASDPAEGADLTIVDFFRVADGKIVEYWDVVTPVGDPDPYAVTDVQVTPADEATEAANLEAVENFFIGLVGNKDAEETGRYLSDDFISHTPSVAGKEGMMGFATWQAENQPAADFVDNIHTIVKGDTVIMYYTYASDPAEGADLTIVDFFRVTDGLIVEYWDVIAEIEAEE